jgi:hypothetical protein
MKAPNSWITYRTRFLVKAKQLNTSLNFTDVLGRQHSGVRGDYLVESSEGVLTIAPRQIFEDIYVPLPIGQGETQQAETPAGETQENGGTPNFFTTRPHQESAVRKTSQPNQPTRHRETFSSLPLPPTFARKAVQPYRDRLSSASDLRSV